MENRKSNITINKKHHLSTKYRIFLNFLASLLKQTYTEDGFARYFENTGWLFLGKISGMVASFLVGAYVARYLGPAKYGLLSYSISFAGLFGILASLGIDNILNRELIAHPENRDKLLGSSLKIKIVGSLISIIAISISLFFIKTDLLTTILIFISALSFVLYAFYIIDIYFQSKVLAKRTIKVQIVSLIITNLLKIVFILLGFGIIYFAIIYFIDGVIVVAGLIISYQKNEDGISAWKPEKSTILVLLKNSWPLLLSGAASLIYMKIDQVMIKNMLGNESAGLYAIAVRLSELWYFIPAIICSSMFPAIMNAKKTNINIYWRRLKSLYILLIVISTTISVFIFLFSKQIIDILFGQAYIGSIEVLKIYVWSSISIFLAYAIGSYLIIENYIKIVLYATVTGAVLNIALNIILIPRYSIGGAAIATLVSYTSVILVEILLIKIKRKKY